MGAWPDIFASVTDFVALLGIDLVICATLLRLFYWKQLSRMQVPAGLWVKCSVAILFVVQFLPLGDAHLPPLAYVRGVTSDFSATTVALACLGLCLQLVRPATFPRREIMAVYVVIAATSVLFYPLALGFGDWDAYRSGWGSPGLWVALLLVALGGWTQGLRLLPALIALSLLSWRFGLMESANLWDYLFDPWLAIIAIVQCIRTAAQSLKNRLKHDTSDGAL